MTSAYPELAFMLNAQLLDGSYRIKTAPLLARTAQQMHSLAFVQAPAAGQSANASMQQ